MSCRTPCTFPPTRPPPGTTRNFRRSSREPLEQVIQSARDFASRRVHAVAHERRATQRGGSARRGNADRALHQSLERVHRKQQLADRPRDFARSCFEPKARPSGVTTAAEGADIDSAGERPGTIPATPACKALFTATFNSYVRDELKWDSDLTMRLSPIRCSPGATKDSRTGTSIPRNPFARRSTRPPVSRCSWSCVL